MRNWIVLSIVIFLTMVISLSLPAQGMVDLNSTGSSELEKLYRVGPKLASKIIAERENNGLFSSLDDVANRIKGIGPKMIEKWEGMAVVLPPAADGIMVEEYGRT